MLHATLKDFLAAESEALAGSATTAQRATIRRDDFSRRLNDARIRALRVLELSCESRYPRGSMRARLHDGRRCVRQGLTHLPGFCPAVYPERAARIRDCLSRTSASRSRAKPEP